MEEISVTPVLPESLPYGLLVGAVLLLIVIAALILLPRPRPRVEFPFAAKVVLTDAELAFHGVLVQCLPADTVLLSKVRLADFLEVQAAPGEHLRHFGRISQKHADFLLVDPATADPLLVIELDDSSHRRSQRTIESDEFKDHAYAAARVPILRIPAARSYNRSDLTARIEAALEG